MLSALVAGVALGLAQPALAPERPRDIWVFRSVLDKRARMVTIALHPKLWVAYDATNCGIYKAWSGGVKFDGAVYTTVHGPQPTSQGSAYLEGKLDTDVWRVKDAAGNVVDASPTFRGYRFVDDRVWLNYDFTLPNGRTYRVEESPEAMGSGDTVVLERTFRYRDTSQLLGGKNAPDRVIGLPNRHDDEITWVPARGEAKISESFQAIDPPAPKPDGDGELLASINPQQPAENTEREPGLGMRVYQFNRADISRIPILVEGQTANVNKLIPTVDLEGYEQFGGPEDNFLVHITGYLNITRPGDYTFRLTSDDGSRFSIRDEVIVDHDGLHGSDDGGLEGSFRLATGEHPVFIEFFEKGGGEVLKLEWKGPGDSDFSVIPASAWTTVKGEVRVTAPGDKTVMDPIELFEPGDRRPLDSVHPIFDLHTVRPETFRPRVGGIDFLSDGRMVICNWEPDGGVYVLDGVTGRDPQPEVSTFAHGLAEPLGIKVVDGHVYVLQKQELTKLIDHDRDGMADEYYAVANGWGVTDNFHEFAFGLVHKDGHFYANLATAIDPGGASTQPQNPDRGKTVKIAMDGSYEFVAHGLRTPNGIGLGVDGEIFLTDNQGDWLPSSKVLHLKEGAFYGNRSVDPAGVANLEEMLPVVWLPQGEIGNSPSTPILMNEGPYAGQMIHSEVTHGGIKRVFVEMVDGQYQGCVFRFTQGLEAGINRIAWGPDGALYAGGIGSTGNWGQTGKERYGLQKLVFNGQPAPFEMKAVRAKANGLEVEFSIPVAREFGNKPWGYEVKRWRYVPTSEYGGPKVDQVTLPVRTVTLSSDRSRAFLELDREAMMPNHVYYIRLASMRDERARTPYTTEGWYTMNRIPEEAGDVRSPAMQAPNTLSDYEKDQGWKLLFNGRDFSNWKGWQKPNAPGIWTVEGDSMVRAEAGSGDMEGGDIVTTEDYESFELSFEFKVSPGGNSGVMFHANEETEAPWHGAPEYQVLDDTHEKFEGLTAEVFTGSDYDMHVRRFNATRPAGFWNTGRIIVDKKHVRHYLNGFKLVDYVLQSPDWERRYQESKFVVYPTFGRYGTGKIVLQDHGDRVWYRNVKIRRL